MSKDYCILPINASMTDAEVREVARKDKNNGAYSTKICKRCGSFWISEHGHWETAEIVEICKECFDEKDSPLK